TCPNSSSGERSVIVYTHTHTHTHPHTREVLPLTTCPNSSSGVSPKNGTHPLPLSCTTARVCVCVLLQFSTCGKTAGASLCKNVGVFVCVYLCVWCVCVCVCVSVCGVRVCVYLCVWCAGVCVCVWEVG